MSTVFETKYFQTLIKSLWAIFLIIFLIYTYAQADWVTSTIDSTGYVGSDTSIAVDSNNKVHISYRDNGSTNSDKDLKYATNVSGSWVTSTVDGAGQVGVEPSIGIDSNNKIHISYCDETSKALKYATSTGDK